MAKIIAIVEGHGEVEAVPILIRRIATIISPDAVPRVPRPIRVKRQRLLKEAELERTIELAARQGGPDGRILILLDADQQCPKELAEQIRQRATAVRSDRLIGVVLAKREYEAWFLAAAHSIAGARGLREDVEVPNDPESIPDPKRWLSERKRPGHPYSEVLDQPALTASFDLNQARQGSPSFEKLWRDLTELLR